MGLFDLFLSEEKKIKKHIRRVTNRDAQPEDREASAHWLAEQRSPTALLGLLARFDMSLDHQMKDAGEKERVFAICTDVGEPIVEPTRVWLAQCKRVAWPLRLYEQLTDRATVMERVLELLRIELEKDDLKPDKKRELLVWLADQRDPRIIDAARPFLADFDEGVRYAAAEAIVAQESEEGLEPLRDVLANPDEDSNRLKARLADVFIARRWPLGGKADAVASNLPVGYSVRDSRIVSQ